MIYIYVVLLALILVMVACGRASSWHRCEASFWQRIHHLSLLDMAPTDAPALLAWVKTHPPSLVEQVRPWRSPQDRRRHNSDAEVVAP